MATRRVGTCSPRSPHGISPWWTSTGEGRGIRRLSIKHRTEIVYAGTAHDSINEARQSPLDTERQRVEQASVTVEPECATFTHVDAFGNQVTWFQVVDAHRSLVVESRALVRVEAPALVPWPTVDGWEEMRGVEYRDTMAEYLVPSVRVRWGPAVEALARDLRIPDSMPVWTWLHELSYRLHDTIRYQPGATSVDTPIEEVAVSRRGVCQDLAHVYIALARRRGVACRYVSGWLMQPGYGEPGESHAWVEAMVPGLGWTEVDPTHPDHLGDCHVRLAVGRDYADAAPLRGAYIGVPAERMTVTVAVREMDSASPTETIGARAPETAGE